jgi:hypothetical protein
MATPHVWAWAALVLGTLGLILALQRALRGWDAPLLKSVVGWLLLVLLVPAQIPRHGDQIAPAFVVFVFEALFQRDGSPDAAARILAAAGAVALALALVTWLVVRIRRRPVAAD